MKNKFLLGAVTGMATLGLAVPTLAQFASAATDTGAAVTAGVFSQKIRPAPTQVQIQDMITKENAFLKNIDAFTAILKSAKQAHVTALTAAALITDDTARATAVQKANQDERAALEAAITANPDLKAAMPFGKNGIGIKMDMKMGHGPADLAAKLGMTEVELKAALDSGKTIEQIATEKGITLPAKPLKAMRGRFGGHGMKKGVAPATTSSAQ